jgi:HlyD family secretion protein
MKNVFLPLGLISIILFSCSKKQEEVRVEYRRLTAAVYASGNLVPEQEYKVMSGVDGYLDQVFVKEGDHVTKGQVMFNVTNEVRQAQEHGAVEIAQQTRPVVNNNSPAMKQLRQQLEVARVKLKQDSLQYARYKVLYEQNAISKSSYEKYFLQYENSVKDYRNAREQIRQQDLAGELQMQQAENQVSLARAQSGYGKLKSFLDGTVYEVYKKKGDLVTPNQPVALIGSGSVIAKLSIDEDDLQKIFEGQKVMLSLDAWPDKVFKGRISRIYPLLNKVEQSFRADAIIEDPLPSAIYGLNVEANILTAENKNVMVIPRAALLKGDSVQVKGNGKIKVKKGIEDDQWVEIVSGLNKESVVIIEK